MAKNKKKKTVTKKVESPGLTLSILQQNIIFIAIIIVYLIILLKPMVIDGLSPQGVDALAHQGGTKLIRDYIKSTGDQALWNPAIFSGMPIYHLLGAKAFSLDQIINWFGGLFSTAFAYYLLGALGMFVLLRYLKMIPLISFMGTMLFILMPHFNSLYLEGHLAKLRAVMFIPWIILCFLYFLDRRSLLSAALFALSFGLQIRTQHYQIVFYSALVIFALGVQPFVRELIEKEFTKFTKSLALLVGALLLGIAMSAQPLFLANEYLPYSKRGKTTISLEKREQLSDQDQSAGVTLDYATQWSTHPAELFTWIIPRFYGGMSGEKYTGSDVPALKNRILPGYWGHMPFTQSYEYIGVITILLAFIGIFAFRREKRILSLIIIALFFILLSFGKHFISFYEIFFNYFPYFNKFRAPMMSVTVTGTILAILAAYGMHHLYTIYKDKKFEDVKPLLWIPGAFIVLGILVFIFSQGFSFSKAGENYEPRILQLLQQVRSEYFTQDLVRYFLISIIGGSLIYGFFRQKVSFAVLSAVLIIVAIFDLTNIQGRYAKEFVNVDRLEQQYFKKSPTNNFILSDDEVFRIMPPPSELSTNRWAYYHQIIGGYSPIKMYAMEEIMQNCLSKSTDGVIPFNWNVIRMLNVKYLVLNQKVAHPNLIPAHADDSGKTYTYLVDNRLPRGFFVEDYNVIPDQYDRLEYLNQAIFDPGIEAILEQEPEQIVNTPDSTYSRLINFNPNYLEFKVYTDKSALFVISESYYPPGWKIYMDEEEVTGIYKTNHSLQSVIVPTGNHKIELKFEPGSYYKYLTFAEISVGLIYLIIAVSLAMVIRERKGLPTKSQSSS